MWIVTGNAHPCNRICMDSTRFYSPDELARATSRRATWPQNQRFLEVCPNAFVRICGEAELRFACEVVSRFHAETCCTPQPPAPSAVPTPTTDDATDDATDDVCIPHKPTDHLMIRIHTPT